MNDIRALLLTDVVDSTQIAERLGDAAAAALGAAHDRLARDLLRAWRGREIDKTDGMLMMFDSASDAVGYALAYHAALATLPVPLKARAGLHVGAVILRANPPEDVAQGAKLLEVEGIAKPVAARVMSLALGGQTLLTAEAREALGNTALRVQSHGHWRIKGIAEPVALFEAGDERAPFLPPPDSAKVYRVVRRDDLWLPLRELRHSLPAERDSFVGRRDALSALALRLDGGARLVSLLGIGGTGKTRLALRFAWIWLGDYPGGAWFCDLSQARDVDGIVQAVAQGLDVPLGNDEPVAQLGHAIAGRGRCLVILDNFEQVARHAVDTLGRWLDRSTDARFVVTTREVLGLPGEEMLALPPMNQDDAQALFERRAAAVDSAYRPSAEDTSSIIPQLIRLLDGLPLAVELAAARVRVMTPKLMLARMGQRFKLLATSGGRHDRQATLRATLDWSWDLLNEAEKSTLAQLSVFDDGFALDAAEAVVDLSPLAGEHDVVELLQSLVDKSFVRRVKDDRLGLLNSVHDYAAERLGGGLPAAHAAEARRDTAERAHCAYYARHPAAGVPDIDNLVAACRRVVKFGDAGLAEAVLDKTWSVLALRGPFRLGVDLAEAILAMPAPQATGARTRLVAGRAAKACGLRVQAKSQLEAARVAAIEARDRTAQAYAECELGTMLSDEGLLDDAAPLHDQALAVARDLDDANLLCHVHNQIANRLMDHGQMNEARAHFEHALRAADRAGSVRWQGGLLGNLGNLEAELGRPDDARANYVAALAAARGIGDLKFSGNTLSNLGLLEQLLGRSESARPHFDEALAIARDIGHRQLEAAVLCNLGIHFDAIGQPRQAVGQFEASLTISRSLRDSRSLGQTLGYCGLSHARMGEFEVARRRMEEGESLLRGAADPVSLALLLCARAEAEVMAGQRQEGERRLTEAGALALAVGVGSESELGKALARTRRSLADAAAASPCPTTRC